jgi:hypothetical protein
MSYPIPPGQMTPPSAGSVAATPPMQKPYPQWMSGMAMLAPTMPGRYATFATWSGAWSFFTCSNSVSLTKIRPGTRIPGLYPFGMRTQFGSIRSSGPEYGVFCMGRAFGRQMSTITSAIQPPSSRSTRRPW